MSASLNLKAIPKDDGSIVVSWNDFIFAKGQPFIGMGAGILLTFVGVYFIDTSNPAAAFLGATLAAIFLGWIPGGVIYFIIKESVEVPREKTVIFTRETVHVGSESLPTQKISRIDYGTRGDWDRSEPASNNDMQIRIWVQDRNYAVASQNNWTTAINNEIHTTLTQALEVVRDLDKQQEHEEKFGVVDNDTGMPDY